MPEQPQIPSPPTTGIVEEDFAARLQGITRFVRRVRASDMQLGSAVLAPSHTIIEQPMPEHRALLVTAFISEEQARRAPRFVALTAADIFQTARAIVLPFPQLPDIHPIAADSFERARETSEHGGATQPGEAGGSGLRIESTTATDSMKVRKNSLHDLCA